MVRADWIGELGARVVPAEAGATGGPGLGQLTAALTVAALLVCVPAAWRLARVAVTLVHELGHALVGVAVGRRFTGFVVRGDMSGHTVTSGRSRGPGLVATTWAGYPAPALVGAGVVWLAMRGWSAAAVTAALLVVLSVALRVRSLFTILVVTLTAAGLGALWWWRVDAVQQQVLVAVGLVLIAGAWRHVLAVMARGSAGDDPAVLARLTHVPRLLWHGSFLVVAAGSSWLAVREILTR